MSIEESVILEVGGIAGQSDILALVQTVETTRNVFSTDSVTLKELKSGKGKYVAWGDSDDTPYQITKKISANDVTSQNMHFNTLISYGQGLIVKNKEGNIASNEEIDMFFIRNNPVKYLLDQVTDMTNFYFSVAVIILSADGSKIVQVRHKEACYIRLEQADENGKINNVFYDNFEDATKVTEKSTEIIPLLDPDCPIYDLLTRTGKAPADDGKSVDSGERKFAILNCFPTAGMKYYPRPHYYSVFDSGWFDIHTIIPKGKLAKFKNSAYVKYKIDIMAEYWTKLYAAEGITDPVEKKKRMSKEMDNIKNFLCGIENSGKVLFGTKYVSPDGKENEYISIKILENNKEGGDWLDDTEEASNMLCYAFNIHPSMVGATPGKGKGGTSGTDKRELFTMKQALSKPYRDILLTPYRLIFHYNNWKDFSVDIPVVTLTTLDKGKDAEVKTLAPES